MAPSLMCTGLLCNRPANLRCEACGSPLCSAHATFPRRVFFNPDVTPFRFVVGGRTYEVIPHGQMTVLAIMCQSCRMQLLSVPDPKAPMSPTLPPIQTPLWSTMVSAAAKGTTHPYTPYKITINPPQKAVDPPPPPEPPDPIRQALLDRLDEDG